MSARDGSVIKPTAYGIDAAPGLPNTLCLQVTSRMLTADNIVAFELASTDGMPLPEFTAGAHIEVDCNGLPRHYSLCGDPSDPMRYMIAVQCEPSGKGGSRYLYDHVHPGDTVSASLPRNHFRLQHTIADDKQVPVDADTIADNDAQAGTRPAKDATIGAGLRDKVLLIAGGIGITPLMAMAWSLHHTGHAFQFHDFAASSERQAFKDYLAQMPWRHHVTRHLGRCDDFMPVVGPFESGAHLYVCGPFAMIDAVLDAARAMGWPETNLHCERFSAPGPGASASAAHGNNEGTADIVGDMPDTAFEVEIGSTGVRIPIAADQSVCAALSAAGVHIPMSCEQGVCGVCMTRVLAGTPDHRDWILSPEEQAANDQFTPCCSRARSPVLVLDL